MSIHYTGLRREHGSLIHFIILGRAHPSLCIKSGILMNFVFWVFWSSWLESWQLNSCYLSPLNNSTRKLLKLCYCQIAHWVSRDWKFCLIHWGRGKMDGISQTFWNAFWMKIYTFRLMFHWGLFPKINIIPALVQIMAWHHPSDKPLCEPMVVSLPMHTRHSASMS